MIDIKALVAQSELKDDEGASIQLTSTFKAFQDQMNAFKTESDSIIVTSSDDKEGMKKAKQVRLKIKQFRVDTEKVKKAVKEKALRESQAIDFLWREIKTFLSGMEDHLKDQEEFAMRETERIQSELRNTRWGELTKLNVEIPDYIFDGLGALDEGEFSNLKQSLIDARDSAIEAARIQKEKQEAQERYTKRQIEAAKYGEHFNDDFDIETTEEEFRASIKKAQRSLDEYNAEQAKVRAQVEKLKAEQAEAQAKIDKANQEKAQAEAEARRIQDEAKAEQERIEAEKIAQAEAERKAQANTIYNGWLGAYDYNSDEYIIKRDGNVFRMYKEISSITIEL